MSKSGIKTDPNRNRRILMALAGMAVAGIAVGFFKRAFFGVDPFQCFCNGINRVVPIGFGTLYMLINAVLLVIDFFLDRHYIGISTFINLFLLGYAVEFSENMLAAWFGEPGLALRIAFLLIGIVISCIAAACTTQRIWVSPPMTRSPCTSPTGNRSCSERPFPSGSSGSSATWSVFPSVLPWDSFRASAPSSPPCSWAP